MHGKDNPLTCQDCDLEFETTKLLNIHRHREHEEELKKLHQCSQPNCNQTFMTKPKLKEHELEAHRDTITIIKCDVEGCVYWTQEKRTINLHMKKIHHKLDTFSCRDCDYVINELCTFMHHSKTVHDNDRPFICNVCGLACISPAMLTSHKKVHTRENFQCFFEDCGLKFSGKGNLQKHMHLHYGGNSKKGPPGTIGKCQTCHMHFADLALQEAHIAGQFCSLGKPSFMDVRLRFFCDTCGKRYMTKNQLNKHIERYFFCLYHTILYCGPKTQSYNLFLLFSISVCIVARPLIAHSRNRKDAPKFFQTRLPSVAMYCTTTRKPHLSANSALSDFG